jgi:hypothetical protein
VRVRNRSLRLSISAVAVALVLATGIAALVLHRPGPGSAPAAERFPNVDRSALSARQLRVMDVLKAQFEAQPPGDTFSEGADEPWCADFVSWVMAHADAPLRNPNSGSWRIPGVYTMQEYYSGVGRLAPAGAVPRLGDVVLWGPDSPMGLHANIVVAIDAATLTTVGGNEGGIHVRRTAIGPDTHLLGYGRLD